MAEKFVRPLINKELELGYQSTLICDSIRSNLNTKQIKFKITYFNFLYIFIIIIYISLVLRMRKTTHVFVHNSSTAIIPLLASRLVGIKKIVYFNHGVPHIGYSGFLKKVLFIIEKFNCTLAKTILTVSNDMKIELKKITSKDVGIINNGSASGINLKEFSKKKYKSTNLKKKLQIPINNFVIVYIGRVEDRKGFNFLLKLWETKLQNKNFTLLICGSDKVNYESVDLKYLGFVNNIPEILSISDCLILPSRHEGLPYAILESLATECPVIASNIPGVSNIIENNVNGLLVDDFNCDKYYKQIILLKENIFFTKKIVKKGINTSKKYCREKFLDYYLKFLE